MQLPDFYPPWELQWAEISVTLLCICAAYLVVRLWLLQNDEAPVEYTIPPPEQAKPGWTGKVLDEPTIKVSLDKSPLKLTAG